MSEPNAYSCQHTVRLTLALKAELIEELELARVDHQHPKDVVEIPHHVRMQVLPALVVVHVVVMVWWWWLWC
jgi:hypothetical protein